VSQGGRREEIKEKKKKEKGKRADGQENGLHKVGPSWRLGPREEIRTGPRGMGCMRKSNELESVLGWVESLGNNKSFYLFVLV
jgi:hypothetical protein